RLLALWDLVPDPESVVLSGYGRLAADTMNALEDLGASDRALRLASAALARPLADIDRAEVLLISARGLSPAAGGWEASRDRMQEVLLLLEPDPSPEARSLRVRALSLLAQNPHADDPVELLARAMALAEES